MNNQVLISTFVVVTTIVVSIAVVVWGVVESGRIKAAGKRSDERLDRLYESLMRAAERESQNSNDK